MARLQILELPTEHHGDDTITPWILVIDQAGEATLGSLRDQAARGVHDPASYNPVAGQVGARTVLVFEETVEIPANGVAAAAPLTSWPGSNEVRALIQEEIAKTHVELIDTLNRQDQR